MAWAIEIDAEARKDLKKLNPQIAKRIIEDDVVTVVVVAIGNRREVYR